MAPRGPQEGPRRPQDCPKTALDGRKTAQDGTRGRPGTAQDAPRRLRGLRACAMTSPTCDLEAWFGVVCFFYLLA